MNKDELIDKYNILQQHVDDWLSEISKEYSGESKKEFYIEQENIKNAFLKLIDIRINADEDSKLKTNSVAFKLFKQAGML